MNLAKHLFSILFFLMSQSTFCQEAQFGNSSDITYLYQDAKRDLQEAIALQSLLAEGRFDEVPQFLRQHNYVAVEMGTDDYIAYRKNDSVIKNRVAGVFPTLHLTNDVIGDGYSDWYVMISLLEGSKDLFIYKINNQRSAVIAFNKCIEPIVRNLGAPYSLISSDYVGDGTATRLSRYKLKITNQGEEFNLTASNFTKLNAPKDVVLFKGPGKIGDINISIIRPVENDDGDYNVGLILVTKLNSTQENQNLAPFNTEKFMSLQNFNDIIWDDRDAN